jgi:hypothetical protein
MQQNDSAFQRCHRQKVWPVIWRRLSYAFLGDRQIDPQPRINPETPPQLT